MTNDDAFINILINRKMLKHFSPMRNFLYGIITYVAIFLLAPIDVNAEYAWATFFYIVLCSGAFCLGAFLYTGAKDDGTTPQYAIKQVKYHFTILLVASLIGILAKGYDTFFIRDLSLSMNMFDNREMSGSGSGNFIAIIAAFFMYAPYALLVWIYCFEKYINRSMKTLGWVIFCVQLIYPLLMGSRSGLLFPAVFVIILLLYSKKIKIRFNLKTFACAMAIFAIGCIISGHMFADRIDLIYHDKYNAAEIARGTGAANTVPVNDTAFSLIENLNHVPLLQDMVSGYVNFCQYYLHGIFECHIQKEYIDSLGEHCYGGYMFSIYMKFFQKIRNDSSGNSIEYFLARPGIFSSVWGPLYADFGWFGILFMFFWGYIQKMIWRVVWNTGNPFLLPWVFLGGIIIFLFPLLNLFSGTMCYGFTFFIVCYFLFPLKLDTQPNEKKSE